MNYRTGSMFQRLALSEAEFRSKFRVDGHPPQGGTLPGTPLHDTANDRGRLVNPVIHQSDRDRTGLVSISLQIASTSSMVLAMP
jgi:hypothetical protein